MDVNSTAAAVQAAPSTQNAALQATQTSTQEFLNLLVTQLQNQDPLEPMKNEDFLAQLAQFQTLEQSITMTQQNKTMLLSSTLASASTLIGREVKVQTADGVTADGKVDSVVVKSGEAKIMIGGSEYALGDIQSVSDASAAA
jgi:flagellar basal-body rod modification protein FlgD